jgi:hypothetical protein
MPPLRVRSHRFVSLADLVDVRRRYACARAPPEPRLPSTSATAGRSYEARSPGDAAAVGDSRRPAIAYPLTAPVRAVT